MADTKRLVAKIDEAIKGLKPMRKKGFNEGTQLAEAFKEKFLKGKPFSILMGNQECIVKCDNVRISRTNLDLGIKEADGFIPLTRVTKSNSKTSPIGIEEDDGSVTPIKVLD